MSEAANDSSDTGSRDADTPETGLISDEQLPDDLQPGKNPLARDPGQEDEDDGAEGADGGPKVEGMPDMGQPGAAG